MCTETPFSCARQRFLMCLPVLQLRHGRRSGDAAPELSAEEGSDPQAEGLLRARGQVCFHTLAPALRGSLPVHGSLGGKAVQRRCERPALGV